MGMARKARIKWLIRPWRMTLKVAGSGRNSTEITLGNIAGGGYGEVADRRKHHLVGGVGALDKSTYLTRRDVVAQLFKE